MTTDYQPGRYVPSTVSQIKDLLGSMSIRMPDVPMPVTGEGMEETYALLLESLDLVRKRIGEERYVTLVEMAQQSKQLFIDGEDRAGAVMLANMEDVISGRKPGWE
jgi:hypothetical protein